MKWVACAGMALWGAGVFLLRADPSAAPAPVMVHIPFVLNSDGGPITTKAQISFPVIPIDKERDAFMAAHPGDADDATLIAYLKALKAGDSAARSKYLAMNEVLDNGSFKPGAQISDMETESYFPTDASVRILGKIPLQTGAAYIFVSRSKDNPSLAFLLSVLAQGGGQPKVYLASPWVFLSVLVDSLSQANLDPLLKGGSSGSPGQVLARQDITHFIFSRASPSAAGDILKAINYFQNHSGKDSFTSDGSDGFGSVSQQNFDKDVGDLDAPTQVSRIQTISAEARSIDYILDFDPIYITVQKKGGVGPSYVITKEKEHLIESDGPIFYYLRGKDGRLRLTNWQMSDEWDATLQALPAPPTGVTQACSAALPAAQGHN